MKFPFLLACRMCFNIGFSSLIDPVQLAKSVLLTSFPPVYFLSWVYALDANVLKKAIDKRNFPILPWLIILCIWVFSVFGDTFSRESTRQWSHSSNHYCLVLLTVLLAQFFLVSSYINCCLIFLFNITQNLDYIFI